jgi:hypothetical protein
MFVKHRDLLLYLIEETEYDRAIEAERKARLDDSSGVLRSVMVFSIPVLLKDPNGVMVLFCVGGDRHTNGVLVSIYNRGGIISEVNKLIIFENIAVCFVRHVTVPDNEAWNHFDLQRLGDCVLSHAFDADVKRMLLNASSFVVYPDCPMSSVDPDAAAPVTTLLPFAVVGGAFERLLHIHRCDNQTQRSVPEETYTHLRFPGDNVYSISAMEELARTAPLLPWKMNSGGGFNLAEVIVLRVQSAGVSSFDVLCAAVSYYHQDDDDFFGGKKSSEPCMRLELLVFRNGRRLCLLLDESDLSTQLGVGSNGAVCDQNVLCCPLLHPGRTCSFMHTEQSTVNILRCSVVQDGVEFVLTVQDLDDPESSIIFAHPNIFFPRDEHHVPAGDVCASTESNTEPMRKVRRAPLPAVNEMLTSKRARRGPSGSESPECFHCGADGRFTCRGAVRNAKGSLACQMAHTAGDSLVGASAAVPPASEVPFRGGARGTTTPASLWIVVTIFPFFCWLLQIGAKFFEFRKKRVSRHDNVGWVVRSSTREATDEDVRRICTYLQNRTGTDYWARWHAECEGVVGGVPVFLCRQGKPQPATGTWNVAHPLKYIVSLSDCEPSLKEQVPRGNVCHEYVSTALAEKLTAFFLHRGGELLDVDHGDKKPVAEFFL